MIVEGTSHESSRTAEHYESSVPWGGRHRGEVDARFLGFVVVTIALLLGNLCFKFGL